MPLTIKPLAEALGAEVIGFDASRLLNESDKYAVLEALYEYLVLVFRDQNLNVAQQVNFTQCLGQLEVAWDSSNTHPVDSRVQLVSNAGRTNFEYRTSSQYWHTDRSFVEAPSMATILHIVSRPPTGGNTLYANMRKAYGSLPKELLGGIENLFGLHSFGYRFLNLRSRRIPRTQAEAEVRRYPDVLHPLVRAHPVTKEKALYLSELCLKEIVGIDALGSEHLLNDLYQHSLQSSFIYEHKWRDGDLVVWDNPSLMHRVSDIPLDFPRVLHRTTTAGPRTFEPT